MAVVNWWMCLVLGRRRVVFVVSMDGHALDCPLACGCICCALLGILSYGNRMEKSKGVAAGGVGDSHPRILGVRIV